jgi:hypothetical protein
MTEGSNVVPHPETTGIQTFTGKMFDYIDPKPEMVDILDIAHGLAFLCRYAGQSTFFYSVAEHSLWVSHHVSKENALVALMHDATEAYCVDLPRPLKRLLPGYQEIEERVWRTICERFGMNPTLPEEVEMADRRMLKTERPYLFDTPLPWASIEHLEPFNRKIVCAPPHVAFNAFMQRFHTLTEGKFAVAEDDAPRIQLLH